MFQIALVPQEQIGNIWETAIEFLRLALKRTGRVDEADLFTDLLTGEQQLWIGFEEKEPKAFATTKVYTDHGKRILLIYSIGGKNVSEFWETGVDVFERFARDQNCSLIEFQGRDGWKVLEPYGFEKTAVVYQKEIT